MCKIRGVPLYTVHRIKVAFYSKWKWNEVDATVQTIDKEGLIRQPRILIYSIAYVLLIATVV